MMMNNPAESAVAAVPGRSAKSLRRVSTPLWIIVIAITITFCFFASSLCISFLLASFLAILFDPIPTVLERWRVPRALTATIIVIGGMAVLIFGTIASSGRVSAQLSKVPQYAERIRQAVAPMVQELDTVRKSAGSLTPPVTKRIQEVHVNQPPDWPAYLIRGVGTVWGAVIIAAVVPFLMFFLLLRKDHLYLWLYNAFGSRIDVPQFTDRMTKMVRGYALGNLVIGSLMAAVMAGVLFALKLDGAITLGILSGFANLIPFLGLVLAALLPILAALLQFTNVQPYLVICATVVLLHVVSANFLIPKWIGSRVNIGPIAATMGMLFWGWLWGGVGILLAVPLTAFIKLVADSHPSLIHLANLLAHTPKPIRTGPSWGQTTMNCALPFCASIASQKTLPSLLNWQESPAFCPKIWQVLTLSRSSRGITQVLQSTLRPHATFVIAGNFTPHKGHRDYEHFLTR